MLPSGHLPLDILLQDWLGEADAATAETVDEHLMHCDACGGVFDAMVALGAGVRDALRAGLVHAVASGAFIDRLAAQGLRVRQYHLAPGGSVNCSVAPEDDVLVSRMQVPLHGVRRLDAVQETSLAPGEQRRLDDIPFDASAGEVVFMASPARVRKLPAHTKQVTLLATGEDGSREIGRYVFRHSPWAG